MTSSTRHCAGPSRTGQSSSSRALLDLATRTYDTYGRLVGVPATEQGGTRAELDAIQAELTAYYDESFDVARTRTGANVRREKRKAARRVREEMRTAKPESRVAACAARWRTSCGGAREPRRCAAGRGAPRRRRRHPGRARHPQAADQDRRQDDPRAHARGVPGPPDGRRDRGDDGAGPPRRGPRDRPQRRLRQGHPGPRGRRAPATARPCRALAAPRDDDCHVLLPRRRAADGQRSGSSPSASRRSSGTTPSTSRSRPPTRSSRSTPDDNTIRAIPPRANLRARPDAAGVPASVLRAAYDVAAEDPDFTATDDCTRRAALPPRRADLGGGGRGAQHEGHRPDRRLPRRQALPAHQQRRARGPQRRGVPRHAGRQVDRGLRRAATASAADIADAGRASTAPTVETFSRSSTNTHVERRADLVAVAEQVLAETRPDRLRRGHRRHPAARLAARDHRGDDLRRHRGQLPRAGVHRPGVLPAPARAPAAACCCSPPAPTRAAAAATASTPRRRPRWST